MVGKYWFPDAKFRQKSSNFINSFVIFSYFLTNLRKLLNQELEHKKTEIRMSNAYISGIFLYNSELWTLTQTQSNTIDSIQRKFLRKILQLTWPKTISNEKLYEKTEQKPWSETVKRRMLWALDEDG